METFTIFCLILGEFIPFPVKIPKNESIGELKKLIKADNHQTLNSIDARSLTLYKVEILNSTKLLNDMENLQLNNPLDPTEELGTVFPDIPKESNPIRILVKRPETSNLLSFLTAAAFAIFATLVSNFKSICMTISAFAKNLFVSGQLPAGPQESADMERKISSGSGSRGSGSATTDSQSPKRVHYFKRKPKIGADCCQRKHTVAAIMELLLKYRFIQVRGTPASGKSTLLMLLHAHILQYHTDAEVFVHHNWPRKSLELVPWQERMETNLPGYPFDDASPRFFLFDEGQTSYWDDELWLTFKDLVQKAASPVHVVIFCNYGNEDLHDPEFPTPPGFDARVTLNRVNDGASGSYGLRLDDREFKELIRLREPKFSIKKDLRDFIFKLTLGHVGHTLAIVDFLMSKRGQDMLNGHSYSLEEFQQDNPSYDGFTRHLANHSGISRGSTKTPASYAPAMKALLLYGRIHVNGSVDQNILSKLHDAHKLGFVDIVEDQYTFASPLIRQIWSWHLLPSPDYQLPYMDLFSFVKATVARFRPSQLTESNRRVGASDHRPPEAQYRDEYYRCAHEITDGNVGISPEYAAATGTRPGCIDFFIPSKKWGIELTRDGNGLDEHTSRFKDDGAYGQWMIASEMIDYVLLDFRSTHPGKSHESKEETYISPERNTELWMTQGIKKLYHIVLKDNATFEIYDSSRKLLDKVNLMEHQ